MPSNHLILCIPFSFCPQSFPASGSFPKNGLFASGGQSIGASASVLPMNIQGRFPLGLTGLISLQSKGLSRVFSSTQFESINSLVLSLLYGPALISIHDYWKLTIQTFFSKVMSLLLNMLARFVIAFLPRSKSFSFMAAVTICSDFGAQENKVCHSFQYFPIYLP